KKVIGEHHPHTLTSKGNLACTYYSLAKFESAQKLEEEVLMLHKNISGKHHPNTLTSMGHLPSMYHALGKLENAQKLKEEEILLRESMP
ncbi:hypothetical protein BDP27DRAFT_1240686, partial [Rhodocollybia butyracea]